MTAPNQLAGITKVDCPTGCTAEQCVISKHPFCFHPLKGGMSFAFSDPAVRSAYAEACAALGVQNIHLVATGEKMS